MTKKVGTSGKYSARYGSVVRKRSQKILDRMKGKIKCPRCDTTGSVHRISTGIWHCKKCEAKFTGGAYWISTPRGVSSFRIARRKQREVENVE